MDRDLGDNEYVAELLATLEAFQTLHTQPIHQLPQDITILSDWKLAIIFKACDGESSAELSYVLGGWSVRTSCVAGANVDERRQTNVQVIKTSNLYYAAALTEGIDRIGRGWHRQQRIVDGNHI